ncbi:MAG: dUTP diphosphatase [Alphaproteobacteria bacterium]
MSAAVTVERLPHGRHLPLPAKATALAAGFDLHAALAAPLTLQSLERAAVPTGLKLAIPAGFEGQVRPRSGLALRFGLTVVNAPGTIDADYRGELMVAMVHLGAEPIVIEPGMRIAQIVFAPVLDARLVEGPVEAAASARGAGGFGSTGLAPRGAADVTTSGDRST